MMPSGEPVTPLVPARMAPLRRYLDRWQQEMAGRETPDVFAPPLTAYQPSLRGLGPESTPVYPLAGRQAQTGPYHDAPYYTARRPAAFGGPAAEGQLLLPL